MCLRVFLHVYPFLSVHPRTFAFLLDYYGCLCLRVLRSVLLSSLSFLSLVPCFSFLLFSDISGKAPRTEVPDSPSDCSLDPVGVLSARGSAEAPGKEEATAGVTKRFPCEEEGPLRQLQRTGGRGRRRRRRSRTTTRESASSAVPASRGALSLCLSLSENFGCWTLFLCRSSYEPRRSCRCSSLALLSEEARAPCVSTFALF